MPKARGDRRTSKVKLTRVLARIGKGRFTTAELTEACKAERVKYDTVQRALLRRRMIVAEGFVTGNGALPQGAPARIYVVLTPQEATA